MICDKNCFSCPYPDCIRDEQQDNRDREQERYRANREAIRTYQNNRYHSNINVARAYHRDYEKNHYDTKKNTEECRKQREKNPDKKKEYDRERYKKKKREGELILTKN